MAISSPERNPYLERAWCLGDWQIHPQQYLLIYESQQVRLTPKAMKVLALLAEARDVVSRDQLFAGVWPQEHITDDVLTHAVSSLRKALGDSPRNPKYIRTIPKKGYLLLVEPVFAEVIPFQIPSPNPISEAESDSVPPVKAENTGLKMAASVWLWIGAVLVAALFLWLRPTTKEPVPSTRSPMVSKPLTSLPGEERTPDFSPDGNRMVFSHKGNLWIKQLDNEALLQITDTDDRDSNPRWHPDSKDIFFVRYTQQEAIILAVSSVGGATRELLRCRKNSYVNLAIHPSGHWLIYSATQSPLGEQTLFACHLASLKTQQLTQLPEGHHYSGDSYPAISPDGSQIAFARSKLGARGIFSATLPRWMHQEHVAELFPGDQLPLQTQQVLGFDQDIFGMTWFEGHHLVYAAGFSTHSQLLSLKIEGVPKAKNNARAKALDLENDSFPHQPQPIALASPSPISPVITRGRLAFVDSRYAQNIWEYRYQKGNWQGQPLLSSTRQDFNPRFSPDGDAIAFASNRSGDTQVWVSDAAGQNLRQLTHLEGPFAVLPSWSHDSNHIVLTANTKDQLDLYTVAVATGQTTPLKTQPYQEASACWATDGQTLYFSSDRTGHFSIWKTRMEDEQTTLFIENAFIPRVIPGQDWLYFVNFEKGGIWRKHMVDGAVELVVAKLTLKDWNQWDITERGLYYVLRLPGGSPGVMFREHQTGKVTELGRLRGVLDYEMAGLSVHETADEIRILIPQLEQQESDIFMVQDFYIDP